MNAICVSFCAFSVDNSPSTVPALSDSFRAAMTIVPHTRLDHYEILSLLGKGGMGEVYLARDARLSRNVALKLLPAEFTQSADCVRRFEHEAKAASALNHPNILTIYEIGATDHAHFIATEYIEGETLRQPLASERLLYKKAIV